MKCTIADTHSELFLVLVNILTDSLLLLVLMLALNISAVAFTISPKNQSSPVGNKVKTFLPFADSRSPT